MATRSPGLPATAKQRALPARSRHAKRARVAGAIAAALVLGTLGLREAVHRVPWFGPCLADGLRAVLGGRAVSWLEERSADVEDRYRRAFGRNSEPRTLGQASRALTSETPARAVQPPAPSAAAPVPAPPAPPNARPTDVGPMARRVAAAGDGRWRDVVNPARPDQPPLLFATLLHPDAKRPWTEVFVVAMPTSRIELYAVAGTREPEATTQTGELYRRTGLIPRAHLPDLLAAFNGGFMTQHGRHGMHVDGVTLVSPRPHLCTLVGVEDSGLRIGTWQTLAGLTEEARKDGRLRFWRQGAPCMYEGGKLNVRLHDEDVRNWGATIDGNVVIRRSAVGLDAARALLYVGVSNDTTARAMAEAMHHAGASDVLQLDVNWSYPKFLLFPNDQNGQRHAKGLFEGFLFHELEYLQRPSPRDFFYVLARPTN